jgi:hypothetical protein
MQENQQNGSKNGNTTSKEGKEQEKEENVGGTSVQ